MSLCNIPGPIELHGRSAERNQIGGGSQPIGFVVGQHDGSRGGPLIGTSGAQVIGRQVHDKPQGSTNVATTAHPTL